MPTEKQILGAKIRAAMEKCRKKHITKITADKTTIEYAPGTKARCKEEVGKLFGKTANDISYYLTYSRRCTHPWSDGACDDCPNYP